MSMNLTKSVVLCIKGSATIALPSYSFETTEVMKDLGILITDTLSWMQHAKKRAEKALNALFVLEIISQRRISRPEKTHISVTLCQFCTTVQLSGNHQKVT